MMRTKQLFKTRLLSFAALCTVALATVSCASEDVAQNGKDTDNDKNFTEFVGGRPETRTTMDYNSGAFYWEAGDKIYVQDDNNVWQVSNNAPNSKVASFKFKVPGKFTDKSSYKVYYPGKNGTNNNVTIPATQNQSEPDKTSHLGEFGDCGTADAKRANNFHFTLNHQAAILVLQPYNANGELNDCYLTKIEVISDNNIAGSYTLDPSTGKLTGTGTSKNISIETTGSGAYANGFPLTNNAANLATNGTYMLIQPGEHQLKIRYYIKDYTTNVEGIITKELSNFDYEKNNYYDMTSNLNIPVYDGDHYSQWDAKELYWHGYEWTKHNSAYQPTTPNGSSSFWGQSPADNRYWRDNGYSGARMDAIYKCAGLINANEESWYCVKGEPHWDGDKIWSTMGHLYKGGMWFLKKANILGYSTEVATNGKDRRSDISGENTTPISNTNIISGPPASVDIDKFFFLPALGCYGWGQLMAIGVQGNYWTSNATPTANTRGFAMYFSFRSSGVYLYNSANSTYGFRAQPFTYFGEDS